MGLSAPGLFQPSLGENNVGTVDFEFSFMTNGASDPDSTLTRGLKVASVTHAATGKYTVTLDAPYYQLVCKQACIDDSSTGDAASATIYVADETVSPLVLTVFTFDATGTKADFTSRRVNCQMKIRLSAGA